MFLRRFLLTAAVLLSLTAPHFARADMEDYPVVKLQSLDKITARTMTFEARVGSTLKYGPLYIKIQSCRKAPPIEQPEASAFLQIWEVTPEEEAKWVFSGWMYASSPSLSPMDHPVYDVWVLDCLQKQGGGEAAKSAEAGEKEAAEAGIAEPTGAPPENTTPVPAASNPPVTEKAPAAKGDNQKMQIKETAPNAPVADPSAQEAPSTEGAAPTQEELDAEHAAETEGQAD